jgi:hypothetical protein
MLARQFTRQASYTETLQIANLAAASGSQAMVLAGFSLSWRHAIRLGL